MNYLTPCNGCNNQQANYSAVKIKINNPTVNIPEGVDASQYNDYKAVDVEVNNPSVVVKKDSTYDYPRANSFVTSEYAFPHSVNMPDFSPIAVAYLTNLINNRTLINADLDVNELPKNVPLIMEEVVIVEEVPEEEVSEIEKEEAKKEVPVDNEPTLVPLPNLTTLEAQKAKSLSFHGTAKDVTIVPSVDLRPEVDVIKVVSNLKSQNYDKQAEQMEVIAKNAAEGDSKVLPYIVTEVFAALIDIVKNDTSDLAMPTQAQIETRKKAMINEVVKEQSKLDNPEAKDVELPYELTKEEIVQAMELSPLEQAERNKEYALYTMAILAKAYTNEVEKITGNVLPITDLPGVSNIVDALRYSENPGVKVAAIEALNYINRKEYNEELESVFKLAAKDENKHVAEAAIMVLNSTKEN